MHRTRIWMKKKGKLEGKEIGSLDKSIHTREEGPTVHLCGDSIVAEKWINCDSALGQKCRGNIGHIQKTLHSWWKRKIAFTISHIDDYVNHIFREHQ